MCMVGTRVWCVGSAQWACQCSRECHHRRESAPECSKAGSDATGGSSGSAPGCGAGCGCSSACCSASSSLSTSSSSSSGIPSARSSALASCSASTQRLQQLRGTANLPRSRMQLGCRPLFASRACTHGTQAHRWLAAVCCRMLALLCCLHRRPPRHVQEYLRASHQS